MYLSQSAMTYQSFEVKSGLHILKSESQILKKEI
jgi:hypothetical protein